MANNKLGELERQFWGVMRQMCVFLYFSNKSLR